MGVEEKELNKELVIENLQLIISNPDAAKQSLGDHKGALEDLNKAISYNSKKGVAYHNRAISKFEIGDTDGACLDLSNAGELGYMESYELIREYCN